MYVQCPNCYFAKKVEEDRLPRGAARVTCPQCGHRFSFNGSGKGSGKEVGTESTPPDPTPDPAATAAIARDQTGTAPPAEQLFKAHGVSFHGAVLPLVGIHIVNILLSIITLSIYRFWGKIRIRKYIYAQSEFMGERFSFHGTGKELFIGWLKAMFLLGGIYAAIFALTNYVNELSILLIYPFLLVVIPFAMVGVRRYRLSRTSWHSIRLSFRGSYREGINLFTAGTLLSIITLGFYRPYYHVNMQNFFRNKTYYGDTKFSYGGKGGDLLKPYLIAFFLTPFTLGLIWIWYSARVYRYDWEHTRFEGLRFNSTITGMDLFGLHLGNFLIFAFTLGLGMPWVMVRILRLHFSRLTVEGPLELEKIRQDAQSAFATGEGVIDFIEIDAGLF
ncbi:MAG: DUF898 family protein [Thermodesulfobacteriota bacterium]